MEVGRSVDAKGEPMSERMTAGVPKSLRANRTPRTPVVVEETAMCVEDGLTPSCPARLRDVDGAGSEQFLLHGAADEL